MLDEILKKIDKSIKGNILTRDGRRVLEAKIAFDRTRYDVKYNSKSFFADLVGDKIIEDEIVITTLVYLD